MKLFNFLQSLFCKSCQEEIRFKDDRITELMIERDALNKQIDTYIKDEIHNGQAEYWNNRFPKARVTYPARENNIQVRYDVRNFVYNKSFILEDSDIIKDLQKQNLLEDELALKILQWVGTNIKYIGDFQSSKLMEFWQDPELTFQLKQGDCEDMAILVASLLLILGIPEYKVKVCASWVEDPNNPNNKVGHAYAIYLASDNKWYILDAAYYFSESVSNFKKLQHKENKKYKDIWWTFNSQFLWKEDNKELE